METDADTVKLSAVEVEDGDLDGIIIPSKSKKQRNFTLLDSDDESLQEHGNNLCDQNSVITKLSPSHEQQFDNSDASGEKNSKGNLRLSRIKPLWLAEDSDSSNSADASSHLVKEDDAFNLSNEAGHDHSNHSSQGNLLRKKLTLDSDDDTPSDQENIKIKSSQHSSGWLSGEDSDGGCEGDGSVKKVKLSSALSTNKRNLKKKANEEMQEIQKQSQRMVRESSVCLPYHKPKQRSLMEILNRKRVSRGGTVKPSPRDVDSVVQVPEDNVKDIEEFFKSESEESESEIGDSLEGLIPIIDHEIVTKSSPEPIADEHADSCLQDSVPSYKEKVENVKRLSIAKISKPTLLGRPGQLLDFDLDTTSTSDQKANVDSLIERFVQQVTSTKKSPQKKDHQISIVHKVMNADGQLELKRDVLNVPVDNNTSSERASAGRRQFLKDSLRQSISAKRAVDRIKKIENQQIENEEFALDDKVDSEPEEEILSDRSDTESEEEEEEEHSDCERIEKVKNMFVEEEAADSDRSYSPDYETNHEVKAKSVVQTSNQSDERSNGFETPRNFEMDAKKLDSRLNDDISTSKSDMKLSLKGFGCSSSFEDLTPNLDMSDSSEEEDIIPKLKCTQNNESANAEELLALCSGKFPDSFPGRDTQTSNLTENADDESDEEVKPFLRIIPMAKDDDDDDEESSHLKLISENDADEPGTVPSFLDGEEKSMSKVKKRARVCLSDDEDEDEDVEDEEMHEEEREFRGLTEFFEDEAELSGSEVGSGDEREDEIDDWEEEEGDKEEIDENEVREQVGRAHMKTMLDQDQREVRLFQELFLEDGDLHSDGDGRQRQFRWKQAGEETEGNDARPKSQEDEVDETAEDQDDLTWRKMRSEREKWLQQQKSQQGTNKDVPLVMSRKGKIVKVNTSAKIVTNQVAESDPSAATSNVRQPTHSKANIMSTVRRGSFLRRSEKDLSDLATLTKSVLPIQAPKNGSNFVFASITPDKPVAEKNRKQKQDGSKCDSSKQNPAPAKKAKISLSAKSIFSYF